jgi:hypothetical protein
MLEEKAKLNWNVTTWDVGSSFPQHLSSLDGAALIRPSIHPSPAGDEMRRTAMGTEWDPSLKTDEATLSSSTVGELSCFHMQVCNRERFHVQVCIINDYFGNNPKYGRYVFFTIQLQSILEPSVLGILILDHMPTPSNDSSVNGFYDHNKCRKD